MKGPRRPVLTFHRNASTYQLVGYCDGSLGIVRDGRSLGVWEPGEETICLELLLQLTGVAGGRGLTLEPKTPHDRQTMRPSVN